MKVVYIVYEHDKPGGAVVAARLLINGMAARGHDVSVITTSPGRGREVENSGETGIYRFLPWNLYWIGDKDRQPLWKRALFQLLDVWNPHPYFVIRGILERERPDLVHVHKLRGLSPSVWSAATDAGVPRVVQTCHDYELASPEGTLSGAVGQWARQGTFPLNLYQGMRRRSSRHVDVATAPSRWTLDFLVERGFFPRSELEVIPNSHGAEPAEIERRLQRSARPRSTRAETSCLFMARLEPSKGVDVLLGAFELALSSRSDLKLRVAGWGSLQESLETKYAEHPAIEVVGPVFGEQKDELLASSDLLLLPSVWPEPFGIVILEAYSYGKPVIVSDEGGMPELVREGRTGWVVPSGDSGALAEAIVAASERGRLEPMSDACSHRALEYCPGAIVDQYEAMYARLGSRSLREGRESS